MIIVSSNIYIYIYILYIYIYIYIFLLWLNIYIYIYIYIYTSNQPVLRWSSVNYLKNQPRTYHIYIYIYAYIHSKHIKVSDPTQEPILWQRYLAIERRTPRIGRCGCCQNVEGRPVEDLKISHRHFLSGCHGS